jgi:hypothetical protein
MTDPAPNNGDQLSFSARLKQKLQPVVEKITSGPLAGLQARIQNRQNEAGGAALKRLMQAELDSPASKTELHRN